MAIKECNNCGARISTSARKCPQCGKDTKKGAAIKVLEIIIAIILIIYGISLIGKGKFNTVSTNNTILNNSTSQNEQIEKVYTYYEGTDIITCQSLFEWGKPFIENNNLQQDGSYYGAFKKMEGYEGYEYEVDGIKSQKEMENKLIDTGYVLKNTKKDGESTIYKYKKDKRSVTLRIQNNSFEITIKND